VRWHVRTYHGFYVQQFAHTGRECDEIHIVTFVETVPINTHFLCVRMSTGKGSD